MLGIGKFALGFGLDQLRTLAFVVLIFGGEAVIYAIRERRHFWSSRPSLWLFASSSITITIVAVLGFGNVLMTPLPFAAAAVLLATTIAFLFVIDLIKRALFNRFLPE